MKLLKLWVGWVVICVVQLQNCLAGGYDDGSPKASLKRRSNEVSHVESATKKRRSKKVSDVKTATNEKRRSKKESTNEKQSRQLSSTYEGIKQEQPTSEQERAAAEALVSFSEGWRADGEAQATPRAVVDGVGSAGGPDVYPVKDTGQRLVQPVPPRRRTFISPYVTEGLASVRNVQGLPVRQQPLTNPLSTTYPRQQQKTQNLIVNSQLMHFLKNKLMKQKDHTLHVRAADQRAVQQPAVQQSAVQQSAVQQPVVRQSAGLYRRIHPGFYGVQQQPWTNLPSTQNVHPHQYRQSMQAYPNRQNMQPPPTSRAVRPTAGVVNGEGGAIWRPWEHQHEKLLSNGQEVTDVWANPTFPPPY